MNRVTRWMMVAGSAGVLVLAVSARVWADDGDKKSDDSSSTPTGDTEKKGGDTATTPPPPTGEDTAKKGSDETPGDEHPTEHPTKKPKKPGKGEGKGDRMGKRMGGGGMFQMLQTVLKKLDADGDGLWTAEELKDFGPEMEKARDAELKKKLTAECDEDGDGKLDEKEQASYDEKAAQAREKMPGVQVDPAELIEKLDQDDDKAISQEEMRSGFGEYMKAKMAEARDKAMIKRFDADGDGKLNEDEQAAAEQFKEKMNQKREGGEGDEGKGKKEHKKKGPDAEKGAESGEKTEDSSSEKSDESKTETPK